MLLLELSPWVSMFINYHTMAPDGFNHAFMKQNRSAVALEHTHQRLPSKPQGCFGTLKTTSYPQGLTAADIANPWTPQVVQPKDTITEMLK